MTNVFPSQKGTLRSNTHSTPLFSTPEKYQVCPNTQKWNAVCQKYQDVLQHPVRFCSMQASRLFWPFWPTILCVAENMSRCFANKAESVQIFDRMTSATMTDDRAFKCKNLYVQVINDYSIGAQSQVEKWVQIWTFISAFLKLGSPKFHAEAPMDRRPLEEDRAVCPSCMHTACNSMYFVRAAAVSTTSKKQKYAIWNALCVSDHLSLCFPTETCWTGTRSPNQTQVRFNTYMSVCLSVCQSSVSTWDLSS